MNGPQFLHCRECDEVFRPSPYDRAREYRHTPDGYIEIMRDDCVDFLVRHARHALRTLRLAGGAVAHEGPQWDPMVTTYWQVTDGVETFVVRGSRTRLEEPLRYELLPGRLLEEPVSVEIPEQEIRERLDQTLYPGVVPERKLAGFVEAFREVVWNLDPLDLETLYDVPSDHTLSVARLPAWALERLMRRVRLIFDAQETARVGAMLVAADEPDAVHVLVRRQLRVVV
jgi:hypothetical protein